MLTLLGSALRVLIGFIVASFAAGAVQVLFALTPTELMNAEPSYWNMGGILLLGTVTITAIFAAPFAFLSAFYSEYRAIRSFAYHGLIGIAIALLGHATLYSGQNADEPSIVNSYAAAAYLTAGLVGGFGYWLVAGRFAGRRRIADDADPKRDREPDDRPTRIADTSAKTVAGEGAAKATAGKTKLREAVSVPVTRPSKSA